MPRTIAVIVLLQGFSSLVGFFALGWRMKMFGYPDSDAMVWNADALFLRTNGLWLMALAPVWGVYAMIAYRHDRGLLSYTAAEVIGGLMVAVIPLAFVAAAIEPGYVPLRFY